MPLCTHTYVLDPVVIVEVPAVYHGTGPRPQTPFLNELPTVQHIALPQIRFHLDLDDINLEALLRRPLRPRLNTGLWT